MLTVMASRNSKLMTDPAHAIAFYPKRRLEIFLGLSEEERAPVFRALGKRVKQSLLSQLPHDELIVLLNRLDPDAATDVLQLLDKRRQEKVLEDMSEELKEVVAALLKFDPDSAAGLMTLDYIQVDEEDTVAVVADRFQRHETRTGRLPVVLVMKDGALAGHLPVHQLGLAARTDKIARYVEKIHSVHQDAPHGEVIGVFRKHPHSKVVVLDDSGSVLGIIYSDDVLDILHEQESASLYRFAGVSKEESVADSTARKVRFRYKWLIINLGTAFLAAFTVGRFEEVLSRFVLLAVYMPIVAGMGGNAATQTLAVMVRGIAQKQITLQTAFRTVRAEMGAGFINGAINGVLVAAVVVLMNRDWKIALILALAMIANLLVAGFFGTIVPLIMSKLGKDPASSATIFITTATDVLGFLTFLGLATAILL